MIVSIPTVIPVTLLIMPTVAFALVRLHVPPETVSVKCVATPVHILAGPEIVPALGVGLIDTILVTVAVPQLLVLVYIIVSTPDNIPVIVANVAPTMVALPLVALHVPPGIASDKVIVDARHTILVPDTATAGEKTVIGFVTLEVHHALLTE